MDAQKNGRIKYYFKELRPDFEDELIKLVNEKGEIITDKTLDNVLAYSRLKGYFKCACCGQEYECFIYNLTKRGTTKGCPRCVWHHISRAKVNETNSFYAAHKEIFGCEPENFKLLGSDPIAASTTAKDIARGSRRKIQINCTRCHTTLISSPFAFLNTDGCKNCNTTQRSKPERALQKLLERRLKEAVMFNTAANINMLGRRNNCDCIINGVIDAAPVVIQYDGKYFHKDRRDVDLWVNERCYAAGYKVIRIREDGLKPLPERSGLYQVSAPCKPTQGSAPPIKLLDSLNEVFKIMNSLGYSLTLISVDELKNILVEIRIEENGIRPAVKEWLAAYDFYVVNGGKTPLSYGAKVFYKGKMFCLYSKFADYIYRSGFNEFEKTELKKRGIRTEKAITVRSDEKIKTIIELAKKHATPKQKINQSWMSQFNLGGYYNNFTTSIKSNAKTISTQDYINLININFYMPKDISLKDWLLQNRPEQYAEVMALATTAA